MKKYCFVLFYLCSSVFLFAQEDRRNVLESDISGIYRKAVKEAFYAELNRNYSLSKGYHGMVDFIYSLGLKDYDFDRFEISSSHGYQFNPYIFVGGGLGLHFMREYFTDGNRDTPLDHRDRFVDVPVFANARFTFIEQNITPFVDIKAGYFLTHHGGLYLSASIGCRFATWNRHAVNLSIGYSYENLQFDTFKDFISSNSIRHTRYNRNLATNSLSFKVGYEF